MRTMAVFGAATILLGLTVTEQAQAQTRRTPASQARAAQAVQTQTAQPRATPAEIERQAAMRRQVNQYRTRLAAQAARRAANAETSALNAMLSRRDLMAGEAERTAREAETLNNQLKAGLSEDWARLELLDADYRRYRAEVDELDLKVPLQGETAARAEEAALAAEQTARNSLDRAPPTPQSETARRAEERRLIQEAEDRRLAEQRRREAEAASSAAPTDTPPGNHP